MIKFATISSPGGRSVNEDYVMVSGDEQDICAVLADGLGGHGGGQTASRTTAEVISQYYYEFGLTCSEQFLNAIQIANDEVQKHQTKECEMKTTVVVLRIFDNCVQWAHVGDSRLYYFYNGKLVNQTLDHSVSQMAVLMKEINQEQIRFHEDRSKVLRAIGSDSNEPSVADMMKLDNGFHSFLLCSDGFWEYVYEEEMEESLQTAKTPQEWLDQMLGVLEGRAPTDQDNYSAIAIFVL